MIRLFAPSTRDRVLSRHPLTAGSLLLHLAAVGALLVPLSKAIESTLRDRGLVYLVPPDNQGAPGRQQGPLNWETPALKPEGPLGEATVPATTDIADDIVAKGDTPSLSSQELIALSAPAVKEELAVTELEVDSTVVRDPLSAAPSYPPSLLARGITGSASVRYVVDTLGAVDTLSYRVIAATHPDFAVAVRRALPDMRFRPAIQRGQRVRQWVEQTFHFKIAPDTTRPPARLPVP